jgi:hypothetical protein
MTLVKDGSIMRSRELLAARIRAEYREMPGLRLTLAQACRLWQLDATICELLLNELVRERFLYTVDGAYLALPTPAATTPRLRSA